MSTRWDRLGQDLAEAGISFWSDDRPWAEMRGGRAVSGVSRSITLRHPSGGTVEISDTWWRKNPDVWIGWEVTRIGTDDIVIGRPSKSKKRSETVAAVQAALGPDWRGAPHSATATPDGGQYLVTCPYGCRLGTSAHAPDADAAERRVRLHTAATALTAPRAG